jgi:hypothetical protein
LIFILELFAGLSKAHVFQIALFIPEDAAHQSQASFDQVSNAGHRKWRKADKIEERFELLFLPIRVLWMKRGKLSVTIARRAARMKTAACI